MDTKYCYAQIDENNICVSVSELSGLVNYENMIALDTYDISLLGKRYNNGIWEDTEPIPTQADRIESLLNQRITETQEQAVDAYTEKLIEEGTL